MVASIAAARARHRHRGCRPVDSEAGNARSEGPRWPNRPVAPPVGVLRSIYGGGEGVKRGGLDGPGKRHGTMEREAGQGFSLEHLCRREQRGQHLLTANC
jgi:hypothetical protein